MLIEIHMIQNHAPSNLNRDDTNSPKQANFGGVMRARVSSQCLKRSIRTSDVFREELKGKLGIRTRGLPKKVKEALIGEGFTEAEAAAITKKATEIGSGKASEDETTRQMIFLDESEINNLALKLKELHSELGDEQFAKLKTDELERRLGKFLPRSVDIALFGRMTTSAAFEDAQAAMQVAHAISTGRLEHEFDYFTAVDDLVQASDDIGAGMIGDVEFNSATYYKYFSLDWQTLVDNLGGDQDTALKALKAFVRAAALTTPTGKQNTFAAHNLPDAILVDVKSKKIPTNFANAFVKPVAARRDGDVVEESIALFVQYAAKLKKLYGITAEASLWLTTREAEMPGAVTVSSLDELLVSTASALEAGFVAEAVR